MFQSATHIGGFTFMGRTLCKLPRIMIDSSLTFNNHVKTICKKASQKLTGISKMSYVRNKKESFDPNIF